MVKYVYDAWGVCDTIVLDENATDIANLNPFRYHTLNRDNAMNNEVLYEKNIVLFADINILAFVFLWEFW